MLHKFTQIISTQFNNSTINHVQLHIRLSYILQNKTYGLNLTAVFKNACPNLLQNELINITAYFFVSDKSPEIPTTKYRQSSLFAFGSIIAATTRGKRVLPVSVIACTRNCANLIKPIGRQTPDWTSSLVLKSILDELYAFVEERREWVADNTINRKDFKVLTNFSSIIYNMNLWNISNTVVPICTKWRTISLLISSPAFINFTLKCWKII